MARVTLTVNGQIVGATVSEQETLLSFLRLRLGLQGAKAVVYLASAASDYVTGHTLCIVSTAAF